MWKDRTEEEKREGSRRVWEKEGNVRFSLDPCVWVGISEARLAS